MTEIITNLKKTKHAQVKLAGLSVHKRNALLKELSKALLENEKRILFANQKDLKSLGRSGMIDRLELNHKRLQAIAHSVVAVAGLADPLNRVLETKQLPNRLVIKKLSVPLGVLGVIYESRPNVTIDIVALALKSGNAVVLKGGKESFETNKILVQLVRTVLRKANLPPDLVYLVNPRSNWKRVIFRAHGLIDALIPRGGSQLIQSVRENSKVPVIETGAGVCHTFVDENFDLDKAVKIVINAKTQRPTVCNSLDTLVVNEKAAKSLLPAVARKLASFAVQIFADQKAFKILQRVYPKSLMRRAKTSDYGKEFLSMKMAVKTVKSFDEGLSFIKDHTSGHSEAIITESKSHSKKFLEELDAAVVYHNASTRFTDGEEFGMGAEVGISTQKLHVRGPMGLSALTSYKWLVFGNGQVRT